MSKSSFKVLVTEPITGPFLDELEKFCEVKVGNRGDFLTEESLIYALDDINGLLCLLTNPVSEKVVNSAKKLKIIANMAVGYNNIDIQAAEKNGIIVTNTPDVLTEATAELTIGLIFATARKFSASEQFLRDGKFDIWDPFGHLGMQLSGKTLGIIGMGKIGFSVAQKAHALGMNICYHNRKPVEEKAKSVNATFFDSLDELITHSDVISLHCPLTDETHHLLRTEHFEKMRESSILINTSRGPVVDEAALAEALHSGQIAGAGLDVFEEEPRVHPDMLTAPNTVLLPHIGSATHQTRKEMARLSYEAIIHIAKEKNPSELSNRVC